MNNIHDSLYGKNKNEAVTNLGDSHQDGHRAGVRTKAETDIGDSKAVTKLGDSHQDGHRAGVKTKAVTNIGDSHQDGHRAGGKDKEKTEGNRGGGEVNGSNRCRCKEHTDL